MQPPSIPSDETFRLEALRSLCVLDTPGEERFDRITRSVSYLFKVPIVLVSLVDATRQWFKSHHGLEATETSREVSFCAHAILGNGTFVVEDTHGDARFADNPLVTESPFIRFYAGALLRGPGGAKIGTLCLIDRVPRVFAAKDREVLEEIASWAEREVNLMTLQRALGSAAEAEAFFTLSPDLACVARFDGYYSKVNAAFTRVLGYSNGEFITQPFSTFIHPEDHGAVAETLSQLLAGESVTDLELRFLAKDGSVRWLNWTARAIDGHIYGSGRDITELKEIQNKLSETESRYQLLTELSPDIVARHDAKGRFLYASPALFRLLKVEAEQVLGHVPTEFVVDSDLETIKGFFQSLLSGGVPEPAQFRVRVADGSEMWLESRGTLVRDSNGNPLEVVITSRDISRIKALEAKLLEASTMDVLTGLPNRRLFMERCEAAMRSATRRKQPMSLCLCDLDGFKEINDVHGHNVGDRVLWAFGRVLHEELRTEDTAARLGGDEFALLFPMTFAAQASECLDRILHRVRGLSIQGKDGQPVTVSCSFGMVDRTDAESYPEQLLEAADRALYAAKNAGKDQLHIGE